MNKVLTILALTIFSVACSSSNTKNNSTYVANGSNSNSSDAKYQIIDQEFDNMLAPDADYETLSDYELQACGDSYLPPTEIKTPVLKKPARKVENTAAAVVSSDDTTINKKTKKVTNTTNIYYIDGPAPATPVPSSSSTTTTTVYETK